jgi:hypothetical protein
MLGIIRLFVAIAAAFVYLSPASSAFAAITIIVTPQAVLIDQRLTIRILGVKPNAPVRVITTNRSH